MLKRSIFLSLAVFACLLGKAQPDADSTLLSKADTARAHGKCKDALRGYNDLITRNVFKAPALVGRAKCTKELEPTMDDLREAIRCEPGLRSAHLYRAALYKQARMFDRAIEDLNVALENSPDNEARAFVLTERGWDETGLRQFDAAERDYLAALALDSAKGGALNDLALVAEETGRLDQACIWLNRFITLQPDRPEGYSNMAFFLSRHDRDKEALEWFDKALAQPGGHQAYVYNNRGYSKFKLGDTKGALKDIDRSIDMLSSNSYAYRNRALVYIATNESDKACTDLEKALSLGFTKQYGDEVKNLYEKHCH